MDYRVSGESLTAVADAIRAKAGTTEAMEFPDGFVSAISEISGGGTPGGETSGLPLSIIDRSVTKVTIPDGISKIGKDAFRSCAALKIADLSPSVEKIDEYAFANCSSLEALVIRKSDGICTLVNKNALTTTPIGSANPSLLALTPGGLPGVPVSSDGNYTDANGQQWVCDEIDFARGVYVQRLYQKEIKIASTNIDYVSGASDTNSYYYNFTNAFDDNHKALNKDMLCNILPYNMRLWSDKTKEGCTGEGLYFSVRVNASRVADTSADALRAILPEIITVVYQIATAIETPLSAAEIAAFAGLQTYAPSTTIVNDTGVYMELGYTTESGAEKTVSGTMLTINDSGDEPVNSLSLYGKTTQSGTPSIGSPAELYSIGENGSIGIYVLGGSGDSELHGYIYIPRALVGDIYKYAANWSVFAAQFRSLEDYTVDGTITGELDESKIAGG